MARVIQCTFIYHCPLCDHICVIGIGLPNFLDFLSSPHFNFHVKKPKTYWLGIKMPRSIFSIYYFLGAQCFYSPYDKSN